MIMCRRIFVWFLGLFSESKTQVYAVIYSRALVCSGQKPCGTNRQERDDFILAQTYEDSN